MPIYEYQCSKCGEVFEAFQKLSDKPVTRCKFCNGKVERLISQSSFQLKGSGWYLSDYSRKSTNATSETDGKAAADKTDKTSKDKGDKAEKSTTSTKAD